MVKESDLGPLLHHHDIHLSYPRNIEAHFKHKATATSMRTLQAYRLEVEKSVNWCRENELEKKTIDLPKFGNVNPALL